MMVAGTSPRVSVRGVLTAPTYSVTLVCWGTRSRPMSSLMVLCAIMEEAANKAADRR